MYPWGNDPLNITLSHYQADIFEEYSTVDVGSKPRGVSPYGVHDMVGNVNEWVSDWWHSEYYNVSPRENPKGPTNGVFHTYRGGSTVSRDGLWRHPVGFRCVRDPKP